MRASSSPTPTARISLTRSQNEPRAVWKYGLPQTTTWVPSVSFTGALRTSSRWHVIDSDMSAAGSRNTMNTVLESCRSLDLGQLALDPDRAETVDPLGDAGGDGPHRPWILGGLALLGRGHLAVARVILLASRVWNGARDLVAPS